MSKYQSTVDWLFKQFPSYQMLGAQAYKPGLENTKKLLDIFGNPHNKLDFIHVAGTNGKGSTSSFLSTLLITKGEKVGLFTSPHVYDFRERIRINGICIPEFEVIEFCDNVKKLNLSFEPSFFEITLTMALCHFESQGCTKVVLETGMGGRLDATNVVQPLISVITNIGLDHQQFLGDTIPLIATEKAGIIKPKTPIIIGQKQKETTTVFQQFSETNKAKLIFAEEELLKEIQLAGYQQKNWHTALVTLSHLGFNFSLAEQELAYAQLTKNTGLFGRMQVVQQKPLLMLDVSHNADGILATLNSLPEIKGSWTVIIGASRDKGLSTFFELLPENMTIHLSTFSNERSCSKEYLKELSNSNPRIVSVWSNVNQAIKTLLPTLSQDDALLVIGSFFLISDVEMDSRFPF